MKIHRQKVKHEREGHHPNITDLKRSGPAESKIKVKKCNVFNDITVDL